ncbi:carboxypeptidase regulatory-like domain-containing protein [Methylovulum psychrotolerans]|uniref:Carboxypeptidase regulatory-like domain-containing protein n=1 Tax=Methylovulum psychrotolerans TaxID=1704499 RepID=A0A1Z4BYG2_9GAMM|nr:carboxypeptidase regulatory-like domain-containing protein [Methylovulum psychrotolerans]ASF46326.1 hypothetical protein CEK71_09685 [Methylovulum psychrotolerans]
MNFPVKATFAAATLMLLAGCSGVEIKGVVRDKPTGNPISSATVSVGKESTATDAMGSYTLEVSDTDQAMIVNAPGYFLYTKTIGKDTINDIDLMPRE